MPITLEAFAADCHDLLKKDPGPAGREAVRQKLEAALVDGTITAKYFTPDNTTPRQVIYEDEDLGFCILAHAYPNGSDPGGPHDHGPHWAIYGQAKGATDMTVWRVAKKGEGDQPSMVEPDQRYQLKTGMARVYNEHTVHSVGRPGPACLIRIEGRNLEGVKRGRYRAVDAPASA